MLMSHEMVTEGHLHSHMKILVKPILEKVLEVTISFILHEYRLNHGLIWCLSNWMEWIYLSWCDLYQRESSRNILNSNLESSRCDSNLQNRCAQISQFRNYPGLSMEEISWLASTRILLPNRALAFATSFNPIVFIDNYICSILVRLVSANWSVIDVDIWLAAFLPNVVVNDGIGIFSR